ncbi:hypothetical protein BELL_1372g00010 [Botrytis elliptica]|uniref:Uncharacterized protein n=1 Tax=Botrytis elliptica TaxID=278938 RepID=A0A4Z1IBL6_9HELO|nr:hypothetical protein BELL_1372g00010 [Botrytis elliptica]
MPTATPTIVEVELEAFAANEVVVADEEDVNAVLEDPDVVLADTDVVAKAAAEILSEPPRSASIVPNPSTKVYVPEQMFHPSS